MKHLHNSVVRLPTMTTNTELWRDCASWLTRCQLIPIEHKVNHPNSQIEELAWMLRDGVLLCNLLNFLDSSLVGLIDFIPKPKMSQVNRYICLNININETNIDCVLVFMLAKHNSIPDYMQELL